MLENQKHESDKSKEKNGIIDPAIDTVITGTKEGALHSIDTHPDVPKAAR
jgi:hypothetical protein